MRILLVTPMPPDEQPTNGVPLVTYALLTELRRRHSVSIATIAGPGRLELEAVNQVRAMGMEVHAVDRFDPAGKDRLQRAWKFIRLWVLHRLPFRAIWFWEPSFQLVLDSLLTGQDFDVVVAVDNAMGMYQFRTHAPLVYVEIEVRKPRPFHWSGASFRHGIRWMLSELDWQRWESYQRSVWQWPTRIQTFTNRDAALVSAIAPNVREKVVVNPFGITLPRLRENLEGNEESGLLVFTGGFSHAPNVDSALWLVHDIMPLIRRRSPGVKLLLVGSDPPETIRALAGPDITVTGRVPEVEPYLTRATVVLAPIRTGGGMRTKVLQAMAAGKALVTTSRGVEGLESVVPNLPLIVADKAEDFAAQTALLLSSPSLRQDLGIRARAIVEEHFSADAYARRTERILNDVLAARQGRGTAEDPAVH